MRFASPTALLGLTLGLALAALSAQPTSLEPGKAIQDDLSAGQTRAWSVTLDANQYLRAVVTQPVAAVLIELYAPDGKKALEMDTRDFPSKPTRILWVSQAAGEYRINVSVPGPRVDPSHYEIKLEELRPARAEDGKRVEAERLFRQAFGEARRHANDQAMFSYTRALGLYREVNDRERESETIIAAATAYRNLSQNERSIGYYEQILAI